MKDRSVTSTWGGRRNSTKFRVSASTKRVVFIYIFARRIDRTNRSKIVCAIQFKKEITVLIF